MLLAACLVFCGALLLCIAMDRHQTQILNARLTAPTDRLLRLLGYLLLGAAFFAACAAKGWAIGSVAWVALCSAAIVALVLLLTYMPRLLPRIGLVALVIGGISGLVTLL